MNPLLVLVEGLAGGAVPGLLASGLAMVHRSTGVLSFAHAAVGAGGAYAAYTVSESLAVPGVGAVVAASAGAALSLPLAPLARRIRSDDHGASILLTLGWALVLETAIRALYGSDVKAFLHIFAGEASVAFPGGVQVPRSDLLLLAVAVLVYGSAAGVLSRTRIGLALRALGAQRDAAASLGLPLMRLEALAWGLSGASAGFSGWLLAPRLGLEPQLLWGPMVSGFVAAALTGLDYPGRALLAGLGMGLVERSLFELSGPELAPILRWVALAAALAVLGRRDP